MWIPKILLNHYPSKEKRFLLNRQFISVFNPYNHSYFPWMPCPHLLIPPSILAISYALTTMCTTSLHLFTAARILVQTIYLHKSLKILCLIITCS